MGPSEHTARHVGAVRTAALQPCERLVYADARLDDAIGSFRGVLWRSRIPESGKCFVDAVVRTADKTGVEMEALTAVTIAALGLIDMVKALDPGAVITDVRVLEKTGGKTGSWTRQEPPA
jgi:hypothetical protein